MDGVTLSMWLDAQRFRHRGSAAVARLGRGLPFDSPHLRNAIRRAARMYDSETGEPADLREVEQQYFARLDVAKQRGCF